MSDPDFDRSITACYVRDFCQLVAGDLVEFAYLLSEELTVDTLRGLHRVDFPDNLGLKLTSPDASAIMQMMREAVEELGDPTVETFYELSADFAGIFWTYAYQASPCESVWFDEDGLVYQEPMFQVREVYRHYGLQAEDWRRRSEDHIAMQLLFVAYLLESHGESALNDVALFLDEHTLRWIGKFTKRVASRCFTKFYAALVALTDIYLNQLREELAEILAEPRPTAEEIEARIAARRQADQTTQATCGPLLCGSREEPKPGRRRYP